MENLNSVNIYAVLLPFVGYIRESGGGEALAKIIDSHLEKIGDEEARSGAAKILRGLSSAAKTPSPD